MSWPKTLTRARRLVDQRGDDADERGLAGAVRPEQREEIALLDVEVDAFQGLHAILVGLDEAADGERIHRARKAYHGGCDSRRAIDRSRRSLEQSLERSAALDLSSSRQARSAEAACEVHDAPGRETPSRRGRVSLAS